MTGANGITGSAITEYLAQNKKASEFSKIIVTSRSPLQTSVTDSRITFIALDFTETPQTLIPRMQSLCSTVTHAYFSSYVHSDDFVKLNTLNHDIFENFLLALVEVAPKLENVTLQTGGKYYGCHLAPIPSPSREDGPRFGPSNANFYYPQEDFLASKQKNSSWTYNVIRPDAIIGTTPKPNGMNAAYTYAVYILTCKHLGIPPRMPTNEFYWMSYEDSAYAPIIADLTVYASTNPTCANHAFNVSNGDYFSWQTMWPQLTSYFGVETSPNPSFDRASIKNLTIGVPSQEVSLVEWATNDKRQAWEQLCESTGCPEAKGSWDGASWQMMDWVFGRTWSATVSISKARRFGWNGYIDSYQAFVETFERMKRLKQIPTW